MCKATYHAANCFLRASKSFAAWQPIHWGLNRDDTHLNDPLDLPGPAFDEGVAAGVVCFGVAGGFGGVLLVGGVT